MGRTNNEKADDPGNIVGYFCFKFSGLFSSQKPCLKQLRWAELLVVFSSIKELILLLPLQAVSSGAVL